MYELRTHIVVDPEIRFGKPCIKGTRITVGDILQWLSTGMTEQEIIADYPELQGIHVRAALAFARTSTEPACGRRFPLDE